jgi:hypothetical protein
VLNRVNAFRTGIFLESSSIFLFSLRLVFKCIYTSERQSSREHFRPFVYSTLQTIESKSRKKKQKHSFRTSVIRIRTKVLDKKGRQFIQSISLFVLVNVWKLYGQTKNRQKKRGQNLRQENADTAERIDDLMQHATVT